MALRVLAPFVFSVTALCGVENPTCELVKPGVYHIEYQASPDVHAVEVYASSRPDAIDSAKPAMTVRQAPFDIAVWGFPGRVYFHLKPDSGETRVVSIRRLPLEGANNFRDLGGYRTADGHYVRWGLVYRSNHLVNLTAKDYEYLNRLGIRLVCDVRTEGERERSPTHWMGPAPEFLSVPVGRDMTPAEVEDLKRQKSLDVVSTVEIPRYDRMPIDDAPQFAAILRRFAAGDLPAVEHCSGGKDRTGVFSAILLSALGVPRDVVMQDYMLTSRYVLAPDSIAMTAKDLQSILGLPQPPNEATVRTVMAAQPEKLESALDSIEKTYGSFDGYLRDGLKLSDSEVEALRERLLQP